MTRIALIHALRESVDPIEAAFATHWPEAERFNLLDDRLSVDRARAGALTDDIVRRFLLLGRYAREAGAEAILFTCSAFGPAIDAVRRDLAPMPVHKPNSAMIAAAIGIGRRIGLLASFAPTLDSMLPEFPSSHIVVPEHCAGALEALAAGHGEAHDAIAAQASMALKDCDVIALAQFSLARAAAAVAEATGRPVLTTPDCAVDALRLAMQSASPDRRPSVQTGS